MDFIKLEPTQREAFQKDGFLVIRNVLDTQTVSRLVEAGDRLAAAFLNKAEARHKPWHNDLDLRPGLLEEDALYKLISHTATVPLIVQLLTPNIHLHSTALIYKKPVSPDLPAFRRGWHRDIRIPRDLGHHVLPMVGIKVCYCLTQFRGEDSGITLMARGSHHNVAPLTIPKGRVDPLGEEVCELQMDAGDAVLFENRINHTSNPNRTNRISKKLVYGYAYRWMKPEIYLDEPKKHHLHKADAVTRQLLGGYRDIDTPPWALQDWARTHGVERDPVPWHVEG